MKRWIKGQLTLVWRATAIALGFTLAKILIAVFGNLPSLAISTFSTFLIIGFSSFWVSVKKGLTPIFAWIVGFVFGWFTLVVLNTPLINDALDHSTRHLLALILIAPMPLAVVAFIGSSVGIVWYIISLRWQRQSD